MISSEKTRFWSDIKDLDASIQTGKLEYLREKFRNDLYDFIIAKYKEQHTERDLTKAKLARRLNYDPAQLNRLLGAPGNWTLKTISDLLVGISGECLVLQSEKMPASLNRNMSPDDMLQSEPAASTESIQLNRVPEVSYAGTSISVHTT